VRPAPSPFAPRRSPFEAAPPPAAPASPSERPFAPTQRTRRFDPDVEPPPEPASFDPEVTQPMQPPAPRQPPPEPQRAPIAVPAAEASELRKARAELEATRARLERDAQRAEQQARLELVTQILPALDDLDRATSAARAASVEGAANAGDAVLVEGVELVRARLERVLAGYGLERIPALGAPFDPAMMEAVAVAPVDDAALDNVVLDEIGRGYRTATRVVRPAAVRVAKFTGA
jgi:molecular chaperone GrpE